MPLDAVPFLYLVVPEVDVNTRTRSTQSTPQDAPQRGEIIKASGGTIAVIPAKRYGYVTILRHESSGWSAESDLQKLKERRSHGLICFLAQEPAPGDRVKIEHTEQNWAKGSLVTAKGRPKRR